MNKIILLFVVDWYIGTPGLALGKLSDRVKFIGYHGLEVMTQKKIVRNVKSVGDEYINSGDLLRIDQDGYVYFVDRLGDTFRSVQNRKMMNKNNQKQLNKNVLLQRFPLFCEPHY